MNLDFPWEEVGRQILPDFYGRLVLRQRRGRVQQQARHPRGRSICISWSHKSARRQRIFCLWALFGGLCLHVRDDAQLLEPRIPILCIPNREAGLVGKRRRERDLVVVLKLNFHGLAVNLDRCRRSDLIINCRKWIVAIIKAKITRVIDALLAKGKIQVVIGAVVAFNFRPGLLHETVGKPLLSYNIGYLCRR